VWVPDGKGGGVYTPMMGWVCKQQIARMQHAMRKRRLEEEERRGGGSPRRGPPPPTGDEVRRQQEEDRHDEGPPPGAGDEVRRLEEESRHDEGPPPTGGDEVRPLKEEEDRHDEVRRLKQETRSAPWRRRIATTRSFQSRTPISMRLTTRKTPLSTQPAQQLERRRRLRLIMK
jgi:hypothetical protein